MINSLNFATGTEYTVEAWFKSPDVELPESILTGKVGVTDVYLTLEIQPDGTLRYLHRVPGGPEGGVDLYSTTVVDDNSWHHLAAVKGADGRMRLYIDGTLEASSASSVPNIPTDLTLYLGALLTPRQMRYYRGELDELRLWSHARTLSEINEGMHHGVASGQPGLAAHYTFDQGVAGGDNVSGCPGGTPCGNTLTDRTENGRTGTLNNFSLTGSSSNFVLGVTLDDAYAVVESNNGLQFDGANDYGVAYGMSFANRSDYTLEGWFNLPNTTRQQTLIAGNDGAGLHYFLVEVTDQTLRFLHRMPAGAGGGVNVYTPANSVSENTWHHFAAVRGSDGKLRLYLDGNLAATSPSTVPDITSDVNVSIGSLTDTGNSRFTNGLFDDLRFWSRARTQAEIQADMRRKLNGTETGLAAYYTFDEGLPDGDNGSGCPNAYPCRSHVLDGTPNHRTLELRNFALTGTTSNFAAAAVVLPVEFTFFTARKSDRGPVLHWKTAREEGNEGFEVERSTNGQVWEWIGFVPGKGTAESATQYRYLDEGSNPGTVFYRLKQLDYDGHSAYSSIVTVRTGTTGNEAVRWYPNPTSGVLNTTGNGDYRIIDLFGKTVKSGIVGNKKISLTDLPGGTYFVVVNTPDGSHTGTVVKN